MATASASRARPPLGAEGVAVRHQRGCAAGAGGVCWCRPSFQGQVYAARDRKTIRKTFPTLGEALAWRQRTQLLLQGAAAHASSSLTLTQASEEWLERAEQGVVRTRSGDPYKPGALRAYRHALDCRLLPRFGQQQLSAITPVMLQDFVDELLAAGRSASTIRNALLPLRAIYRRALQREQVATNPTLNLSLPAVRSNRDRIARVDEATALLAALPAVDRALWATALYAGLRMGELQALNWADIDLEQNLIHVRRSWDRQAGFIDPKSRAGKRRVPLTQTLRTHLLHQRDQQDKACNGAVFPNSHGRHAFTPSWTNQRARNAWHAAGLEPIGLHECRHTYAAYMIAAGVNPKSTQYLHGPLNDHHHPRPLRPPPAR